MSKMVHPDGDNDDAGRMLATVPTQLKRQAQRIAELERHQTEAAKAIRELAMFGYARRRLSHQSVCLRDPAGAGARRERC